MKYTFKKIMTILILMLVMVACKKEGGNPLADIKNLSIGSYPTLQKIVNLNFDGTQIATSKVAIRVKEYKSSDPNSAITEIKIYAVKGASTDKTNWKLVKTVPYSSDSTLLEVSGTELATALGVPAIAASFTPGDYYTFYNVITTKGGQKFDINTTPGALGTLSAYKAAFVWQAYITCPFTGGMEGDYEVVQDDWADWSVGDIVRIKDVAGKNQISLEEVWPNPSYGDLIAPIIVNVDPSNGVASVPKVIFADYGQKTSAQGYSAAEGVADDKLACGYVFSCSGFISLNIRLIYGTTDYGPNKLVLKRL
jgi:hypothetical protein